MATPKKNSITQWTTRYRGGAALLFFTGGLAVLALSSSSSSFLSPVSPSSFKLSFRNLGNHSASASASASSSSWSRRPITGTGTVRTVIHGTAGFNNQRQVVMVHAWAAKELGYDLLLPSHFNAVKRFAHSSPGVKLKDVYDIDGIREYVGTGTGTGTGGGGNVDFYDHDPSDSGGIGSSRGRGNVDVDDDDDAAAQAREEVLRVAVDVNSNCLGGLTGDALRSAVDEAVAVKVAKLAGSSSSRNSNLNSDSEAASGKSSHVPHIELELIRFRWETIDAAFPDTPSGKKDAHDLITSFKFVDDITMCAEWALTRVLGGSGTGPKNGAGRLCPGGIHGMHLRVGDRVPLPLFDCGPVGEDMLGGGNIRLKEDDGSYIRQCIDVATGVDVKMEDVLAATLPPPPPPPPGAGKDKEEGKGKGTRGVLSSDQCVYVATNCKKSHCREMKSLRKWAETEGNGVRIITYDDIITDDAMTECRPGGGGATRAITDPSLFEQALLSRVAGRFVSSYPSSWDSYVLHARVRREEMMPEEEMFMAREDLDLYRAKSKMSVKVQEGRFGTWCFRALPPPPKIAASVASRG